MSKVLQVLPAELERYIQSIPEVADAVVIPYYRIHISQLSVIAAAKVSYFEILCRVHNIDPTVGLFHPYPKSTEFNAGHYATLVAYPAPLRKYPEPFLCLVGMSRNYTLDEDTYPRFLHDDDEDIDLLAFIRTADPTKVKVVAPDRSEGELEASIDKLFDEGSSTEQGDFAAGGDDTAETGVVRIIDDETMAAEKPKRLRKKRQAVADASGPFHPPKKLRDDHGTSSGAAIVGKSLSIIKELLASSILNVDVGASAMPTLPFVTSPVSTTLEREGDVLVDFVTGVNLPKIDSLVMSFVPVMTTATIVTSAVDPASVVKEKLVEPSSFFVGSSSAGGTDHITGDFSDLTGSDFLVGAICTVIEPDVDLQKVYVPQWSVTNGSRLDDGRVYREMVDEFAPSKFFVSIHGMEHD
ncbi:hypothetical protein Tco_0760607 [Tanacetum coccineum]